MGNFSDLDERYERYTDELYNKLFGVDLDKEENDDNQDYCNYSADCDSENSNNQNIGG